MSKIVTEDEKKIATEVGGYLHKLWKATDGNGLDDNTRFVAIGLTFYRGITSSPFAGAFKPLIGRFIASIAAKGDCEKNQD